MIIREANIKDKDPLLQMARQFASSFETDETAYERSLPKILSDTDVDLLVADDDDSLVGYILAFHHETFFANGTVTWVEELFVSESERRQGIGRNLVQAVEEKAKGRESRLIALATRRAAEFYASIGYEDSATYYRKLL